MLSEGNAVTTYPKEAKGWERFKNGFAIDDLGRRTALALRGKKFL